MANIPCNCGHLQKSHKLPTVKYEGCCNECYEINFWRPPLKRKDDWSHSYQANNLLYLEELSRAIA